jgi:signal transduction histidine kinase
MMWKRSVGWKVLTVVGLVAIAAGSFLIAATPILVVAGLTCVLTAWGWSHTQVRQLLRRLAEQIAALQRSGQLPKLSGNGQDEVAAMVAAFRLLAKQVEEQRWRLGEQIVELERVNAELDQLATLKDDFLATINHQLRTPVTAVLECIELIRDGALGSLTQDQQSFVRTMDLNVMQLANLVEEVLDLSLVKSGQRSLQRQSADLIEVLRRSQASWQATSSSCTIRLACHELPPVYMDTTAIQQVMDHLLRNALRHAPKRSEVLIEAQAHDGVVDVSVHNQGPRMSPEQLAKLFEPFTHLHKPEAPGSQGSGLGLAFCRQVIERHRGVIRADSAEGRGSTFTFSLPIASKAFLFEEACRKAQEDAQHGDGQFGLVVTTAQTQELMQRVEAVLRRHTARRDQFLWADDLTLVIVAVTNQEGLEAMSRRLRGVLSQEQLDARLVTTFFPKDGDTPERLLETARTRVLDAQRS